MSTSQPLPEALQYRMTKPQGFPSSIKEVRFYPVNSSNCIQPGETIRWEIRSNGFLDPHSTRINFDVECKDLSPEEIRRVDGSAHAFFNELIIQSRGVIIERLQELDVLTTILHDVHWNHNDRIMKQHEGHGISVLELGEYTNLRPQHHPTATNKFQLDNYRDYDPTDQCLPSTFPHVTPRMRADNTVGITLEVNTNQGGLSKNIGFTEQYRQPDPLVITSGTANSNASTINIIRADRLISCFITGEVSFLTAGMPPDGIGPDGSTHNITNQPYSHYDWWLYTQRDNMYLTGRTKQVNITSIPSTGFVSNTGYPDKRSTKGYALQYKPALFLKGKQRWCFEKEIEDAGVRISGYPKNTDQPVWGEGLTGNFNDNLVLSCKGYRTFVSGLASDGDLFNYLTNVWSEDNLRSFMYDAGGATSQFQNTNNYQTFMTQSFQTGPWTTVRQDKSRVYELTPDFTNVQNYDEQIEYQKLYYPGFDVPKGIEIRREGYQQPVNGLFSIGTDEPYFAGSDVPVYRMLKGKPKREMGRTFMQFSVPFASAILGILLPRDLFKYVPMSIFEELVIELKTSQHALFTSGFKQNIATGSRIHNEIFDWNYGKGSTQRYQTQQHSRNYQISRVEMVADILSFGNAVESLVLNQWNSENGIILQTHFWSLGPQYTFQNALSVGGTHQINLSFGSLKSVFWRFLLLDYETKNYCRKQFAISHNLRKFQFALGQNYYPQDGIRGHAGTIFGSPNDRFSSNREFYVHMLKAFGVQHEIAGRFLINPLNYTINDRCYDPNFKGPYYTATDETADMRAPSANNRPDPRLDILETVGPSIRHGHTGVYVYNGHTALQLPGFHENRVVGKCLYAYSFETLTNDWGVLSGINTYDFKPFNIIFEVDTDAKTMQQRESRLFMFLYYDGLIQFRSGLVPAVVGRA